MTLEVRAAYHVLPLPSNTYVGILHYARGTEYSMRHVHT